MNRFKVVLGLLAILFVSTCAYAEYVDIAVTNFSFEEPGVGKIKCWDGEKVGTVDVPGWSSDLVSADSGVESDWPGSTEGVYSGFLGPSEPSVWQILPYIIEAGDEVMLQVDARDNWTQTGPAQLEMSLFYLDIGGCRMPLVTETYDLTGGWETYMVSVAVDDIPDSVGRKLGTEFRNPLVSQSWIGLDNVRVPEPATIALLGFGSLAFLRRKRS